MSNAATDHSRISAEEVFERLIAHLTRPEGRPTVGGTCQSRVDAVPSAAAGKLWHVNGLNATAPLTQSHPIADFGLRI
jgi:hypothetical protein